MDILPHLINDSRSLYKNRSRQKGDANGKDGKDVREREREAEKGWGERNRGRQRQAMQKERGHQGKEE